MAANLSSTTGFNSREGLGKMSRKDFAQIDIKWKVRYSVTR